jgi:hypothetical protein
MRSTDYNPGLWSRSKPPTLSPVDARRFAIHPSLIAWAEEQIEFA